MANLTATLTFSIADNNRCVKVTLDDKSFLYDKQMILNDAGMFALIVENFCLDGHISEGTDIIFAFEDGEEDLRTLARNEFNLTDGKVNCSSHGHSVSIDQE
jgi:hypothetical protein